ncbi:MAG: hypothetical protein U0S50_04270 [Sphingopyxis sp.]|uniref:hypothetical protein n=1 Tax=Sphingopyxis sp. TaxID=1908224 RepID=UPI002AB8B076|nr:hypothetical protein [Sphingopyxis sp.]MDZ3831016.1 hypothetical protein [Sphingopyxis sp.]
MSKTILRPAIAAVVGILLAFGLVWVAQYAGNNLSPMVFDPDTGEILIPLGSTIALFIGWFVGTFGGGWLAMRISGGSGAGWIVAGAVIGAALYRAVTLADSWWVMALGTLIPLVAIWLAERTVSTATTD